MWAPVGRCWDRVEECPLSNPTLLIYLRSFNILSAFGHRHSISRSCRRKCFNRSRYHCKLGRSKIRSSQRREQGRAQSNRMGSEQSRDHTLLVTVSLSMPPTVNKTNLVFQVWAPTTVIGWRSCELRTSPIPSSRVASSSPASPPCIRTTVPWTLTGDSQVASKSSTPRRLTLIPLGQFMISIGPREGGFSLGSIWASN